MIYPPLPAVVLARALFDRLSGRWLFVWAPERPQLSVESAEVEVRPPPVPAVRHEEIVQIAAVVVWLPLPSFVPHQEPAVFVYSAKSDHCPA